MQPPRRVAEAMLDSVMAPAAGSMRALASVTWLALACAAAGAGAGCKSPTDPGAGADAGAAAATVPFRFTTDFTEAKARAGREKRPMLLFFSADWNHASKQLGKVLEGPRFAEAASRFVGVKVDVTNDESPEVERVRDAYRMQGVPTVILLDEAGHETHRSTSYESEEAWLARIAQMK